MEGVAAFSLACNIMQTVQFSLSAAKLCKDLYRGSSPDKDVESYCARLRKAVNSLKQTGLTTTPSDQQHEQQLQKVAKDVISAADNIQKELDKLRTDSQRSRWRALKSTATYMMGTKRKIDRLNTSLEKGKDIMETQLLISLRNRTLELQGAMQAASLATNDQLLNFLKHLQDGHTKLENLVDSKSGEVLACIRAENEATRNQNDSHHTDITKTLSDGLRNTQAHVESAIDSHLVARVEDHKMEMFLNSLKYQDMDDRQNSDAINRTHEKTFQWILQDSVHDDESLHLHKSVPPKWSNFVDWLVGENSIYWISGKPASGKSNLMRFITTNPETMKNLEIWRPKARIITGYVWLAGNKMQRSQKGLVASLLYLLLSSDPEVIRGLQKEYILPSKQSLADWSLRELEGCLVRTLHSVGNSNYNGVCIFIDGLDEIDPNEAGGKSGLIKMLERLSNIPHTKLCVASREENVFQDAYGSFPKIRLQDLNKLDILEYVTTSLQKIEPDPSMSLTQEKIDGLVKHITYGASGVFLWASVVVNNIIRAYNENSDDFQQLRQRVEQLPSDLSKLYTEMWKRLNPDDKSIYQAESALYFRLVLESEYLRVSQLGVLLCAKPEFAHILFTGGSHIVTDEYVRHECRTLEKQIHARCAGLLQISPSMARNRSRLGYFEDCTVSFVHRSAVDWFRDTFDVHTILQHEQRSTEELQVRVRLGRIATLPSERQILQGLVNCIRDPLLSLEHDLRSQVETKYLEFVAGTLKRSSLWGFLETDLHLVELAVWTNSYIYVQSYLDSTFEQNQENRTKLENRILSWLCSRLFSDLNPYNYDTATADDFDRDPLKKWIGALTLISSLLSKNSALYPCYSDKGLCYLYGPTCTVQPAIVSFLLALNQWLETSSIRSQALEYALLNVLCDFLEHENFSDLKITVGIGDESQQLRGYGSCWSRIARYSDLAPSPYIACLVKMEASQIFRYSRQGLVHLDSFSRLPKNKQSLIEAFLDVPERPMEGERLSFRHKWKQDEKGAEIWGSDVYSTSLDPETLNAGIQLAEDGHKALLSDDPEDHRLEQMDIAQRRRFDNFWGKIESNRVLIGYFTDLNDPGYQKIRYGREIKDIYSGAPEEVSLSDIDWSEKPQYSILDQALKDITTQLKQKPTEDL